MIFIKEVSGIVAVLTTTAYALYVLFYRPKSVTVNTCGNNLLRKYDVVDISGIKYRVIKVNGEQLKIRPRRWF